MNPEFLKFVKLHEKKLKELHLGNVVNASVNNAFLFPAIDMSLEPFSWGELKLSTLQQFCNLHMSVWRSSCTLFFSHSIEMFNSSKSEEWSSLVE